MCAGAVPKQVQDSSCTGLSTVPQVKGLCDRPVVLRYLEERVHSLLRQAGAGAQVGVSYVCSQRYSARGRNVSVRAELRFAFFMDAVKSRYKVTNNGAFNFGLICIFWSEESHWLHFAIASIDMCYLFARGPCSGMLLPKV